MLEEKGVKKVNYYIVHIYDCSCTHVKCFMQSSTVIAILEFPIL